MHLNTTCVAFAEDAGIGSVLRIARRLLNENRANRVLVFCATQSEEHAEPLEELLALKDRHLDRLSLSFVMNREPEEDELLSGRLDCAKVRAIAAKLFDPTKVREYYVCGPQELVDTITGALKKMGVDDARVHGGVVAAPAASARAAAGASPVSADEPAVPTPAAANETRVEIVMDGRRRAFSMHTGTESILDAAGRAGVDLPFSCRAGVCSTCRTKLVRGKVEMKENYALEDWELEQGFILACQSHATTPEIELNYDEK
jgi:ring-1,2-phenylacetyl-CoA epoxidase subunit PaaE